MSSFSPAKADSAPDVPLNHGVPLNIGAPSLAWRTILVLLHSNSTRTESCVAIRRNLGALRRVDVKKLRIMTDVD